MDNSYFMGRDGFVWFTGVVEDRNDPSYLGRVRVRCFGYHTEDNVVIPTEDLPWAHVMMTIHDPSMNGLGNSPSFLVEGTWVVGFFRDPDALQEPIVMGTLPGVPSVASTGEKGFQDPNAIYPLRLNEPDTNRLAVNLDTNPHPVLDLKELDRTTEVPIANSDDLWNQPSGVDTLNDNESQRVDPLYPYNHVFESESGHIREMDDTVGSERIHEYHKSGTFYEIDADGNKVTRIVGDSYEVVAGTSYVNVKGNVNLTIDGGCNTYIKGDWNIQVDGTKTEVVIGAVSETYQSTKTENVTGNVSETYGGNQTTAITGNLDVDAARIDLN